MIDDTSRGLRSAVDPRASFSVNKVTRRRIAIDPFPVVEEKYGDDHAQSNGQIRSPLLRYMALRTVHCNIQIVLDHNAEHGSNLSVSIHDNEHSYGRFLRIHGRNERCGGIFSTLHQARYSLDSSTVECTCKIISKLYYSSHYRHLLKLTVR